MENIVVVSDYTYHAKNVSKIIHRQLAKDAPAEDPDTVTIPPVPLPCQLPKYEYVVSLVIGS